MCWLVLWGPQPQINCSSPTPATQEKLLEHQSLPTTLKKVVCSPWWEPSPLIPNPLNMQNNRIPSQAPQLAVHTLEKENNHYWNTNMASDNNGFSLEEAFFFTKVTRYSAFTFQFPWNSPRCHFVPLFLQEIIIFSPILCYRSEK